MAGQATLEIINFETDDSGLTVDRNWSMKLSQAVKSPLKLGRLICGNFVVILVGSTCIVARGLIGLLDAAIILFAACRVWRAAFFVFWHWSNTWSYSASSVIASSSSISAVEHWTKQCSSSIVSSLNSSRLQFRLAQRSLTWEICRFRTRRQFLWALNELKETVCEFWNGKFLKSATFLLT